MFGGSVVNNPKQAQSSVFPKDSSSFRHFRLAPTAVRMFLARSLTFDNVGPQLVHSFRLCD